MSSKWQKRASDLFFGLGMWACSYAPLFAIFAIRFRDCTLVLGCALAAIFGVAFGLTVMHRFKSVTSNSFPLRTVEDRGSEVAAYLGTYLLPFVTVTEPSTRDLVAYGLFLALLALVYIRSDLIQVNPTLYVFGWRTFAVRIGDTGWNGFVFSRTQLAVDSELSATRITERIFVHYEKT